MTKTITRKQLRAIIKEELLRERSTIDLVVLHSWEYDDDNSYTGQWSINGKKYSSEDERAYDFEDMVAKTMQVDVDELNDWFENTFDVSLGRAGQIELTGTPGDLTSFDGNVWDVDIFQGMTFDEIYTDQYGTGKNHNTTKNSKPSYGHN